MFYVTLCFLLGSPFFGETTIDITQFKGQKKLDLQSHFPGTDFNAVEHETEVENWHGFAKVSLIFGSRETLETISLVFSKPIAQEDAIKKLKELGLDLSDYMKFPAAGVVVYQARGKNVRNVSFTLVSSSDGLVESIALAYSF